MHCGPPNQNFGWAMAHPAHASAPPCLTRPFTASVVRPADNLLVSLDLDPSSATKMVSEVGFKDEFSGKLLDRKTRHDEVDDNLIEADLFGRE